MASWWPGNDLGKWALVLAIVLFLLQKPWDWFQSLAASKLKDWWAARSIASLQKRIAHQETELKEYERHPLISETEAHLLRGLSLVGSLCLLLIQVLFMVLAMVVVGMTTHPNGMLKGSEVLFLGSCAAAAFAINEIFERKFFRKMDRYRRPRSPQVREELESSIRNLKLELAVKSDIKIATIKRG